jgi:hypothetical protein
MRPGEFRTARLLCRLELHQFNACQIWIVEIELPLSVFAHLRFLLAVRLPSVRLENCLRIFHIRNSERNMVHYSRQPQIGMLWLTQHVLQPVRSVWNLNRHPVGAVVFHSAMPVRAKAENVAIEMILRVAVIHQKAGVNDAMRNCGRRGRRNCTFTSLYELDAVPFGIFDEEIPVMIGPFLNLWNLIPLAVKYFCSATMLSVAKAT